MIVIVVSFKYGRIGKCELLMTRKIYELIIGHLHPLPLQDHSSAVQVLHAGIRRTPFSSVISFDRCHDSQTSF